MSQHGGSAMANQAQQSGSPVAEDFTKMNAKVMESVYVKRLYRTDNY